MRSPESPVAGVSRPVARVGTEMKRKMNPFVAKASALHETPLPDIEVTLAPQFAQCGEDYIILSMLRALALQEGLNLENQTYCELGASYPIAGSSTYLLHIGLGMTGVLVEANPDLIGQLSVIRKYDKVLNVAVTPKKQKSTKLYISSKQELSSIDAQWLRKSAFDGAKTVSSISVKAQTIDEILANEFEHQLPIFVSIDLEGIDRDVLENYSFFHRPYIIQIEANVNASREDLASIQKKLTEERYATLALTDVNLIAIDSDRTNSQTETGTIGFSASRFNDLLSEYELISVDVFDTLLSRRTLKPSDVFAWIQERYNIDDFHDRRVAAESKARDYYADRGSEVSLDEIYRSFDRSSDLPANIIDIEMQAEGRFLFANPSIRSLINSARRQELRIIALSDIYLSGPQINLLLKDAGVEVDKVYSSSDFRHQNIGKYNGAVFHEVAKTEAVEPSKILHIGDNAVSDIINAQKAGVGTLRSELLHENLIRTNSWVSLLGRHAETATDRIVVGQVAKRAAISPVGRSKAEQLGYAFGGPLVLGFLKYAQSLAETQGMRRLVLLERDGCIVSDAASLLPPGNVPIRLAPSSRRMSALPCLAIGDPEPFLRLFTKEHMTEAQFFDQLVLPHPEDFGTAGGTTRSAKGHLDAHTAYLASRAELELQALRSEFQEELEILARGGKVAWLDVGWALSSASALNKLLGHNIPCYCIGSNMQVDRDLPNDGYLFKEGLPTTIAKPVVSAPEIVELIFSDTRPLTVCLLPEGDGIRRVVKPQSSEEIVRNCFVSDVRQGVLSFVSDIADLWPGLDQQSLREFNRRVTASLCGEPSHGQYAELSRIPHDRFAGASVWATVGDYWQSPTFGSAERDLLSEISRLESELSGARNRPLRAFKRLMVFELLRCASFLARPIAKKTAARLARSAQKRNPKRSGRLL